MAAGILPFSIVENKCEVFMINEKKGKKDQRGRAGPP